MLTTLTDLLTEYKDATKDPTTENNTRGIRYINRALRMFVGKSDYTFRHKKKADTTVADQANYALPVDFDKFVAAEVTTTSDDVWPMEVIYSQAEYNRLIIDNSTDSSDIAEFIFIDLPNNEYRIYPKPDSSGNTINLTYLARQKELENEDYTTGTISITAGATAVTGVGTTFTAAMVGQYIELDNEGYLISAVGSTTSLTIDTAYQGTTLSGAAYRIGDASLLPDTVADLPYIYAAKMYYMRKDSRQYKDFENELDRLTKLLDETQKKNYSNLVLFKRKFPQRRYRLENVTIL